MINFCKCGSIIINDECSNAHCPYSEKLSRTWIIDGVEVKFKELVTRKEAEEKGIDQALISKKQAAARSKEDDFRGISSMRDKRIRDRARIII